MKKTYRTPQVEILSLKAESMLCTMSAVPERGEGQHSKRREFESSKGIWGNSPWS